MNRINGGNTVHQVLVSKKGHRKGRSSYLEEFRQDEHHRNENVRVQQSRGRHVARPETIYVDQKSDWEQYLRALLNLVHANDK